MSYRNEKTYAALRPSNKAAITRLIKAQPSIPTIDELLTNSAEMVARIVYEFRKDVSTILCTDHLSDSQRFELIGQIASTIFQDAAIRIWQELTDRAQAINAMTPCPRSESLVGRVVVVSAAHLAPAMRYADRRFKCTGGFGSEPDARGNAVFGSWLADGCESRIERYMVEGFAIDTASPAQDASLYDAPLDLNIDVVEALSACGINPIVINSASDMATFAAINGPDAPIPSRIIPTGGQAQALAHQAFVNDPSLREPFFAEGFGSYVCNGDTITTTFDGFEFVARIEPDDTSDSPDDIQDGFWPSLDPNDAGFIGDGYKTTAEDLSDSFEFIDHGVTGSQYFLGCGTVGTDFDHVATGIGSNAREAFDDALEKACSGDDRPSDEQIEAIEAMIAEQSDNQTVSDDSEDSYHYASIRYNVLPSPFEKAKKQADDVMQAWRNDEWHYVGIILSVSRSGITLSEHATSLWGLEANYPGSDNSYLTVTADELLEEALDEGRKLCKRFH